MNVPSLELDSQMLYTDAELKLQEGETADEHMLRFLEFCEKELDHLQVIFAQNFFQLLLNLSARENETLQILYLHSPKK